MTERTYELRAVGVDYLCDACGDGVTVATGLMLPTDPPKWPHQCNKCGHTANLEQKYPTVRFERVPGW